jgi:hypothetical protein
VQSVFGAHCTLQDEPQAPAQLAVPPQASVQPAVCAVHPPDAFQLHAPLPLQEHAAPLQVAGTLWELPDPEEPHAKTKERRRDEKRARQAIME